MCIRQPGGIATLGGNAVYAAICALIGDVDFSITFLKETISSFIKGGLPAVTVTITRYQSSARMKSGPQKGKYKFRTHVSIKQGKRHLSEDHDIYYKQR